MKIKRIKAVTLALCVGVMSLIPTTVAQAAGPEIVTQEPIAAGATRYEYSWALKKGNVTVDVVKCDLNNPNLKVDLVVGGGKYTQKATVSQMANRTGAVALVNGDFFNMNAQGSPLGASINSGKLLTAPMNSIGYYTLGLDNSNKAYIEQVTFGGHVTASNGTKYPIQGLNKAEYWDNITGAHSHTNTINVYNENWASKSRGKPRNKCVELLVNPQGKVEEISSGKTLGYAVPEGKMILQANDGAKDFVAKNIKVGDTIKVDYTLYPQKDWKMMIGAHGLLVNNGKAIPYALAPESIAGNRARTAAGISADGKTLWMVAAEGKSSRSKGLQLSELASFMEFLGCHKAVNFDGGGSTAMSVASTGELKPELVINPEGSSERYVVNGLGVYNIAEEGPLHAIKVKGPSTMLIGETASFEIRGWDANYKAKDVSGLEAQFTDDKEGSNDWYGNNKLTVNKGNIKVLAQAGGMQATHDVKIVGADHIKEVNVVLENPKIGVGETTNVKVTATTKTGRKVEISPRAVKFQVEGYEGNVDAETGILSIDNTADAFRGKVVANLDGAIGTATMINPEYRNIHMTIGKKTYAIDGEEKKMDTSPIIIAERTMVPLRFLVESVGGTVEWNEETRTATVDYQGTHIEIPLDSKTILVNGKALEIDSPATIRDSRTLIPIRFVTESLGMQVEYDPATKSVDIYEKRTAPVVEETPVEEQMPELENKEETQNNNIEPPLAAEEPAA